MKIPIVCGNVLKGPTEKVYFYLVECETMPSIEQIMEATGLTEAKVRNALMLIRQQVTMYYRRKNLTLD